MGKREGEYFWEGGWTGELSPFAAPLWHPVVGLLMPCN
jgi:hypothetical protein